MKHPNYIPADYGRIKVVSSLSELLNEQFGGADEVNCVLFPRKLSDDFNTLARHLAQTEYFRNFRPSIYEERLYPYFDSSRLQATKKYMKHETAEAANVILQDMAIASRYNMRFELRVMAPERNIRGVDTWHHDNVPSHNSMMGRFMCCYNAPVTEGVRNEDVTPVKYESPFGPFNHYSLKNGVQSFSFAPGDLWRQLSTPNLKAVAPPYIHRAPALIDGGAPRLLLVASC